jgi:hypothetical protein
MPLGALAWTQGKLGFRGVEYRADRDTFRARIAVVPGNRRGQILGTFGTAVQAAEAYDEAARRIYGADAHLNFPGPGEKGVVRIRRSEGMCYRGHDLTVHGRPRSDDPRRIHCRECNRLAVLRYAERQKVAKAAAPQLL